MIYKLYKFEDYCFDLLLIFSPISDWVHQVQEVGASILSIFFLFPVCPNCEFSQWNELWRFQHHTLLLKDVLWFGSYFILYRMTDGYSVGCEIVFLHATCKFYTLEHKYKFAIGCYTYILFILFDCANESDFNLGEMAARTITSFAYLMLSYLRCS